MSSMEHLDTTIIGMRHEQQKTERNLTIDLSQQQIIYGNSYAFETHNYFDGKMNITIPITFKEMPDTIKNQKYLNAQKPEVLLSNPDYTVDLALNLLQTSVNTNYLPIYLQKVKYTINRVNPSTLFYEAEQIETINTQAVALDFKSFSLSGSVYNLLFLASITGRLMLGSFNIPFDIWEEWKPVMTAVIKSIEDKSITVDTN